MRVGYQGSLLLAIALILPVRVTRADSPAGEVATRLNRGEAAYRQGDYGRVVEAIQPLLYPANRLPSREAYLLAHKLLAISSLFSDQREQAEQSFIAILAEDPSFALDASVEPASAVKLVEDLKRRNAEMLRKIEERQAQDAVRQREERTRQATEQRRLRALARQAGTVVERRVDRHLFWVNFVPFGAGQFQNGQRAKGIALLVTESVLGAISVGSALALRLGYPDNRPAEEAFRSAQSLNTAQVVSGALFWGAVLYGIFDALAYYRAENITERQFQRPVRLSMGPQANASTVGLGLEFTY